MVLRGTQLPETVPNWPSARTKQVALLALLALLATAGIAQHNDGSGLLVSYGCGGAAGSWFLMIVVWGGGQMLDDAIPISLFRPT